MALASFAKDNGERITTVEAAIKVNEVRIDRVVDIIKSSAGKLANMRIGVLGATFKDDTDDLRESQAIKLIERLKKENAIVIVYDPRAKSIPISGIGRAATAEECINESTVIVVATEWHEFKDISKYTKDKLIVDAKRILDQKDFKNFRAIGLGGKHES